MLRRIRITLGVLLSGLKRRDEALASYERAYMPSIPNIDFLLGDLLHTKMYLCIWDDLAKPS